MSEHGNDEDGPSYSCESKEIWFNIEQSITEHLKVISSSFTKSSTLIPDQQWLDIKLKE